MLRHDKTVVHVYLLLNNISVAICLAHIRYLNLQPTQVLLLLTRNTQLPSSAHEWLHHRVVLYSFEWVENLKTINPFVHIEYNMFWGNILKKYSISLYELYLPHSYFKAFRVLTNFTSCRGFYYLEEGLSAYTTQLQLEKSRGINDWVVIGKKLFWAILHNGYFNNDHAYFYVRCKGVIVTSQDAFPELSEKITIKPDFSSLGQPINPPPAHVLLVDGWFTRVASIKKGIKVYQKLLQVLSKKNVQALHVKMHPGMDIESRRCLMQFLQNQVICRNLQVYELADTCIVESIPDYHSNVAFYTAISSAALYINRNGCETYELFSWLRELFPAFKPGFALPRVYQKYVNAIRDL